jgi:hypothetical protein
LKGIWIFQDELQKSHRREYFDKSRSYITRQERDAEIAENRASRRHHPYGRQQQQQMHMQQQQHQDSFPLQEMQMRQQLIDQQIHIEQMRMGQQQLQLLQRQQNYNEDFSQDVYADNLMAGGARQAVTGNVAQIAFQATAAMLSLNSGVERGGGGSMMGMHPNNGMGPPLVNPSLSFLDDTFAQAFIPQQQHQGYAANNARSYNQYNSYQPAPGPIEPWVIDGTWFNDTAFAGGGFADQAAVGGAAYRQHFPSQEDQRYQQLSHENRQFVRGGGRHGGGGGRKRR